jgi:hypothetical protein
VSTVVTVYKIGNGSVNGKTITVRLTDEQARDYQPWFDNARRLHEITAHLEQLALREVETDPRSPHQT